MCRESLVSFVLQKKKKNDTRFIWAYKLRMHASSPVNQKGGNVYSACHVGINRVQLSTFLCVCVTFFEYNSRK